MILITGGLGFIGSHIVVDFIENGYSVCIVDNLCNTDKETLNNIEKITKTKIPYYENDIRDFNALLRIFSENNINSVIHLAGLKSVYDSVVNPIDYYSNNFQGTLNLLEVMKKKNIFKFIFSSSACVYKSEMPLPWNEKTETGNCITTYGKTKYFIEQMLMDLSKSDQKWKIGLLRYFNPTGAHESGLLGENPKKNASNLMPYLCKVALGEFSKLNIYGNDYKTKDGTGVRDYLHVQDLAAGHRLALEKLEFMTGYAIWNFGSGKGYSVLEMIKAFEKVSSIKIPYDFKPRRIGDQDIYYTDNSRAKKELNWHPKRDLSKIMIDVWNYIKKRKYQKL